MDHHQQQRFRIRQMEWLWWLLTAMLTLAVLLPIIFKTPDYPFYFLNVVYVVVFVTVSRYLFLLDYTFLATRQRLKHLLVFLFIPLIFYLVQELNHFQTFLDEEGIEAVVGNLPLNDRRSIGEYVHSEMLLFGVGSIISSFLFPFRLVVSIWRTRNRPRRKQAESQAV